jgi:hypothetical protein
MAYAGSKRFKDIKTGKVGRAIYAQVLHLFCGEREILETAVAEACRLAGEDQIAAGKPETIGALRVSGKTNGNKCQKKTQGFAPAN